MASNPTKKRKCTVLPRSTVEYLKNWMMSPEHITHPYPTEKEKAEIMAATGIELKQLTNWFVNNRKRFWKPRVEARMQQHLQTRKTVESLMSKNKTPSTVIPGTICNLQQQQLPFRFSVANTASTTISDPCKSKIGLPPIHSAFQIITNHHTFVPPSSRDDTDNINPQVVSMGSVSYSSDTDNNSLANSSSDGNEEETFYNFSSKNQKTTPSIEHVQVQDGTFQLKQTYTESQIVSPSDDSRLSQSRSKKRTRGSSVELIAQPRSLAFNVLSQEESSTAEPDKKRQCDNDWEAACRNARHGYDHSLPSLEEAATLFGFTTNSH